MGFQPYDMNGVHVVHLPSGTTGTFTKGDAVFLSSGVVTVAATTTTDIYGVAAAPAITSGTVPVYVADPSSVWVGEVDGVSVVTNLGTAYGIVGATGSMAIELLDTTTTIVRVIAIHPADGYKTKGRVLFCWMSSSIQGN
jgi:hypothetical protein